MLFPMGRHILIIRDDIRHDQDGPRVEPPVAVGAARVPDCRCLAAHTHHKTHTQHIESFQMESQHFQKIQETSPAMPRLMLRKF